jgi:hypothetical protein
MCNGDGGAAFIVIVSHKEKTKRVSLAGIVVKTKGGGGDFLR